MKNQLIGTSINVVMLTLCIAGGLGFENAENLFSAVIVVQTIFFVISAVVVKKDNDWGELTSKEYMPLKIFQRILVLGQILASFAFGWFVIGGLHLATFFSLYVRRQVALKHLENAPG